MIEGALQPGTKVAGRYVVERLLGKGGMGAVYEARHEELGRQVALKVLLPGVARNNEMVTRFFREARTAAAIHHPGIVEVFDLGRDGELAYIVMEKLGGEELAERIRRAGPLGPRFVALLGMEIAEAISAAHERGVIHRDLKPQNVFLAERGRDQEVVKVLDFGIAKLADAEASEAQLTKTGEMLGTPLYMPPEQLQARKDIDPRADVYSIGVILYEALSGTPPFRADSYAALVLKIVEGRPPPLAVLRPELPPALVAVVERAMATDREQRFATAGALAAALFDLTQTLPPDPVPEAKPLPPEPAGEGELERTAPRMSGPHRYLASLSKPATPLPLTPPPQRATNPPPSAPAPEPPRSFTSMFWWAATAVVVVVAGGLMLFKTREDSAQVMAVPPVVAPLAPAVPDASVPLEAAVEPAKPDAPIAEPPKAELPKAEPPRPETPKTNHRPPPKKTPQVEEQPPALLPR